MNLNILYITTRIDGIGGLQKVQIAKWNYWTEFFGYKITVLITNSLQQEIIYPLHPKIQRIEQHPNGKGLAYLRAYKKIVKKTVASIQPDIIMVSDNGYKAFLIPKFLSNKLPIFFESHGAIYTPETEMNFIKRFFHKNLAIIYKKYFTKNFKGIITLTHKNALEFGHKNYLVLPNPLLDANKKLSTLENKKVIVYGRNSYEKGYDLLLEIWKNVVEKHPDWFLELYITENFTIDLRTRAKNLSIEKYINFYEPTLAIIGKISDASIHLLPSRTEGFGMVILETMACGVPTIAFDCPVGPAEIITNHLDGILIKPFDIQQFANSICYLIEHPNIRKELGNKAVENVKKYELEPIMLRWKLFFEQFKA